MTVQRVALVMTLIVLSVLLCLGLAACLVEFDFTTAARGRIEPRRFFAASVTQAGRVHRIAGQGPVSKGDCLLALDSTALIEELGIVTQGIARLEQEIAREAPPLGSPRRRFDLGQQVAARKREALRLSEQLSNRLISAPFDGQVVAAYVHTGEWVTPADDAVLVLVDDSSWRLEATTQPEDLRDIEVGAAARIRVAGYPYRTYGDVAATVRGIELTESAAGEPVYEVTVRLDEDPSFTLVTGQRATALITSFHGTLLQYVLSKDRKN